jgi:hypothetical protein
LNLILFRTNSNYLNFSVTLLAFAANKVVYIFLLSFTRWMVPFVARVTCYVKLRRIRGQLARADLVPLAEVWLKRLFPFIVLRTSIVSIDRVRCICFKLVDGLDGALGIDRLHKNILVVARGE